MLHFEETNIYCVVIISSKRALHFEETNIYTIYVYMGLSLYRLRGYYILKRLTYIQYMYIWGCHYIVLEGTFCNWHCVTI